MFVALIGQGNEKKYEQKINKMIPSCNKFFKKWSSLAELEGGKEGRTEGRNEYKETLFEQIIKLNLKS